MKRLLRSDGFDVIVVGSGLAGLSAALTVAEFGYSPVILEKTCEPGGLTRRAYGFFNAADARRQIALGIDDSPEKHLRQALEVSRGKAREPLMRTLCYEAYSTLQWLEALGLEFEPGIRRVLGGVYPRTHMPLRGAGEAYLSALRSALRPFGVPIVCNAEVTALRKSGDAVTGVEGLLSGEPFRLTSRLGVVLAGGGFSRNMEMMRLYAPGLSDVLPALDEGADGSLIQAAADIGAALVGMSYFEVRLFASTLGLPGDPSDYILVNARGERFMREDRRRSTPRRGRRQTAGRHGLDGDQCTGRRPPQAHDGLQGDGHRDDLGLQRLHSYEGKGFPRTRSPHDEADRSGRRDQARSAENPLVLRRSRDQREGRGDRPQGQTHEETCGRGRHYGRHSRRTRPHGRHARVGCGLRTNRGENTREERQGRQA